MKYAEIKAFMFAFRAGEIGRHEMVAALKTWQAPIRAAKLDDTRHALADSCRIPYGFLFPRADGYKRVTEDEAISEAIQ